MTAPQTAAVGRAAPSRLARARDVLAFEWTKLRSVRSNYWTLLIAAVVTLGVTAIAAQAIASAPGPPPGGPVNPLTSSFLGYGEYTVLPVTVLSVLTFTSEYASGLIRTTFTAVPRRRAVLAAKAAVIGAAALIAGELLAYQLVTAHPQPGLLSPGLSMLVLIGWPSAALLAAAVVITRRDA